MTLKLRYNSAPLHSFFSFSSSSFNSIITTMQYSLPVPFSSSQHHLPCYTLLLLFLILLFLLLLQVLDLNQMELIYGSSFFKSIETGGNVSKALVSPYPCLSFLPVPFTSSSSSPSSSFSSSSSSSSSSSPRLLAVSMHATTR